MTMMSDVLEERNKLKARAEAAEKRVKELEAEAAGVRSALGNALVTGGMNWPLGDRVAEVMKHGTEENKKFVEAANRADRAEYALKDAKSRITKLEADLAAARTVPAHKLVADVVEAVVHWDSGWVSGEEDECTALDKAVRALRDSGITVQPVRMYVEEDWIPLRDKLYEARCALEAATNKPIVDYQSALGLWNGALRDIRSALMSVPAEAAEKRVKELEATDRLGDALAARAVKRATEEEESMRKLMLEALEERDTAQKRVKELEEGINTGAVLARLLLSALSPVA